MNMRANISRNYPGRTYRFYNGKSIYQFGHGLSYTIFSKFIQFAPSTIRIHLKSSNKTILPNLSSNSTVGRSLDISDVDCKGLEFDVGVGVRNIGDRNGTHVVLLFWKPPNSSDVNGLPRQQLIGFDRVQVTTGQVKHLSLKVNVCRDLNVVDGEGKRKLLVGAHTLVLGSSSERQVRHQIYVKVFERKDTISSSILVSSSK